MCSESCACARVVILQLDAESFLSNGFGNVSRVDGCQRNNAEQMCGGPGNPPLAISALFVFVVPVGSSSQSAVTLSVRMKSETFQSQNLSGMSQIYIHLLMSYL